MRLWIAAVVLALVSTGCTDQGQPQPDRLPDLVLPGLRSTDESVHLAELTGPLLINVWASYCEPCRTEMPLLAEFARAHPEIKVLGIDYTDPDRAKARRLAKQSKAGYPLVVDDEGALPVRFLPQWLVVDAQGVVVERKYTAITSTAELEALVKEHLS